MTDEELENKATDWIRSQGWSEENLPSDELLQMEQAFLAGLKAGKPKWHKVADGDLPKEEAEYFVIFESDGTRYTGLEIYYPDTEEWSTICNIIAWCEIPKFEETE